MLLSNNAVIKQAKKILSLANLKDRFREMYYAREDALFERNSWETAADRAMERGLKKGLEQGRMQGIEQGEYKAKIEMAYSMIQDKFSSKIIAKYTGLSEKEIESLK